MIGKQIFHYKIVEKLDEGGMGVLYKAVDIKLNRTVVLKFLPREYYIDSKAKERFINEAQATSALDHPNICTIHEICEADDGQLFIVMALYEGQTLRDFIKKGRLTKEEAISITIQIAQGLQHVHAHNIIHRDIKPENIFLTNDKLVKILDFGLAKLVGQTKITKLGFTPGTVAYMSPEQAKGQPLDQRTDIWSVGVILYEMLSGENPFNADYEQAIIYSIINENVNPIRSYRTDTPKELESFIIKALSKNPDNRFSNMKEMIQALKSINLESSSKSVFRLKKVWKKKILYSVLMAIIFIVFFLTVYIFKTKDVETDPVTLAVVDFVNYTEESELDGLSGMLATALQQSKQLNVFTRSRMFDILKQLDKENINFINESLGRNIARNAKIRLLVIADIRKFDRLYNIDLKVLDTQADTYLFSLSKRTKGKENIPYIIDALSEETRRKLKETESSISELKTNIATLTTPNLDAYHHYFQGQVYLDQVNFQKAEKEFRKAIQLDTTFALAYYRLAYAMNWEQKQVEAAEYIFKAVKYIDNTPKKYQYLVRAVQENIEAGFESGIAILHKMEKIYPNNKEMLYNIGDWSYHLKHYEKAEEYLNRVLHIDPKFMRALQHLTWLYKATQEYDKALITAEKYCSIANSVESYELLLNSFKSMGKHEKGRDVLLEMSTNNRAIAAPILTALASNYMRSGNTDKAISYFRRALKADNQFSPASYYLASLYSEKLQDKDKAINLLKQSVHLNPESETSLISLANLYEEADKPNSAIIFYQQALNINPFNDNALKKISKLKYESGAYIEAIAYSRRGLELKAATSLFCKTILYKIKGLAHKALGDHTAALKELKKSYSLNPFNYDIAIEIAALYAEQNATKKGLMWLSKAFDRGFDQIKLLRTRAEFKNLLSDDRFGDVIANHFSPISSDSRKSYEVNYILTGDAMVIDLSIKMDGCRIGNFHNLKLPWSHKFFCRESCFIYVAAETMFRNDSVNISIAVNDSLFKSAKGGGRFVVTKTAGRLGL